jgi:hypothetical protein
VHYLYRVFSINEFIEKIDFMLTLSKIRICW